MKKVIFILVVALVIILGSLANVYANSLEAHLVGSDNLNPSYGLSFSAQSGALYASAEDLTNKGFELNTALLSAGMQLGPVNFGPVAGAQFKSSSGTTSGMLGAELGIKAEVAGPLFIKENNRVLRGAGGVSNGQVDFSLGFNF